MVCRLRVWRHARLVNLYIEIALGYFRSHADSNQTKTQGRDDRRLFSNRYATLQRLETETNLAHGQVNGVVIDWSGVY